MPCEIYRVDGVDAIAKLQFWRDRTEIDRRNSGDRHDMLSMTPVDDYIEVMIHSRHDDTRR